jgi:hypothetical protein
MDDACHGDLLTVQLDIAAVSSKPIDRYLLLREDLSGIEAHCQEPILDLLNSPIFTASMTSWKCTSVSKAAKISARRFTGGSARQYSTVDSALVTVFLQLENWHAV